MDRLYGSFMAILNRVLLSIAFVLCRSAISQQPVVIQRTDYQNGMPSSGGYVAPANSLMQLMEHNQTMSQALMKFAGDGDRDAFRATVLGEAEKGNLAAELTLAEQYIPEQCTFEPNQDVPHCGTSGDEAPRVVSE